MNKNIFTILTFLFGIPGFVYAQDFKPEEQAQGYLNNKNVLLDHTTGSFNYNVPLFELISGYYKLPISLQYTTARDLNTWSLQTGGIVTRIVRGGVPDDNTQKGYPFTINKDTVLQDDLDRVNTHKRDGESDIFIASFNGRSVYFIIKKDGNTLVAEPLERTNVKIECKYVNNRIMGWDVLDENGIRYIYNLSSSVKNLSRDAPILLNQIGSSDEYISSWYLSQVKIPNSESIYYYYKLNDTITTTSSYQSHTTPHNESNRLTFTYGKPMLDIPLDYESIRQEVEDNLFHAKEIAMTSATSSLAQIAVSQRFQGAGERSSALAKAGAEVNIYRQYETVLGIFSSLGKVRFPSPDVLQVIDELMDFYEPYDNNGYLHRTKRLIEQMLTTKKRIHTKEIYPTTKYTVYYPVLEKITSKNQEAYFEYTGGKLKSITLSDPTGKQTRKVIFTKRNFTLGDIIWLGSDGTKIGKSSFFYTDPRPSWNVLQKIITPEKAEIELTYENNRCGKGDSVDGIRIKTLVLRDGGGRVDTMKFNYPYPGYRVYDYIGKIDTLNYSSFSDYIHSREYIYRGNVLINRGNSGIYYHYVEEEFVGKGTVSYLFSVPRSSASNPEHIFPF